MALPTISSQFPDSLKQLTSWSSNGNQSVKTDQKCAFAGHVTRRLSGYDQVYLINAPWCKPDNSKIYQRNAKSMDVPFSQNQVLLKKQALDFEVDGITRKSFSSRSENDFVKESIKIKVRFSDCEVDVSLPDAFLKRLGAILRTSSNELIRPSKLLYCLLYPDNYYRYNSFDLRKKLPATCHQFANFVLYGDDIWNEIGSYLRQSSKKFSTEDIRPGDKISLYEKKRLTNLAPEHSMIYLRDGICIHQPGIRDVEFNTIDEIVKMYEDDIEEVELVIHRESDVFKKIADSMDFFCISPLCTGSEGENMQAQLAVGWNVLRYCFGKLLRL